LNCLSKISSVLSLISILFSSSEILSSTCSSPFSGLPLCFSLTKRTC
jgi:hypothetical protein